MTNSQLFPNSTKPLIGLNGRFLVAKRTGVQRSAFKMFQSIIEHGSEFNFVLFTGESEAFAQEWKRPNVRVVTSNLSQSSIIKNHLWEQFVLPMLASKYNVDILHNPANLAPLLCRRHSIVNIHDLCFLVEPAWFSVSFRLIYTWLVPRIAKASSIVITNSNSSKNDILQWLKLEVARIRLTYWAVDPLFFEYSIPYNERASRILFVGSLEPRKNLSGLLAAFNLFRERNPERVVKLTVVGCENPLFADETYDLGAFKNDIEFSGYVTDRELAALYGDSLMLVYPSYYEGFGFPPLEAMAAGTPVITSRSSSLPEVVGEAALLVDPADTNDIAERIDEVFNPLVAASLIQKGQMQVRQFNWDRVGKHVLQIYRDLLSKV